MIILVLQFYLEIVQTCFQGCNGPSCETCRPGYVPPACCECDEGYFITSDDGCCLNPLDIINSYGICVGKYN